MPPEYHFIVANERLVNSFIKNLDEGSSQFRYFQKRPVSVIKNHLVTALLIDGPGTTVAYGHLERENQKLWLGIAVADNHVNKGLGKLMMRHLVNFAKNKHEPLVHLSVDKENLIAQRLYKQFGFKKKKEFACSLVFELKLS